MTKVETFKYDIDSDTLTSKLKDVSINFEIGSFPERETKPFTLYEALDKALREQARVTAPKKYIHTILGKLQEGGFNVDLVQPGEKFKIEKGKITITSSDDSEVLPELDLAGNVKKQVKASTLDKTRKNLEGLRNSPGLDETNAFGTLCDSGILANVRRYLGLSPQYDKRKADWSEVLGAWDEIDTPKAADLRDALDESEDYQGSSTQNLFFIEYYRWKNGGTVSSTSPGAGTSPAPGAGIDTTPGAGTDPDTLTPEAIEAFKAAIPEIAAIPDHKAGETFNISWQKIPGTSYYKVSVLDKDGKVVIPPKTTIPADTAAGKTELKTEASEVGQYKFKVTAYKKVPGKRRDTLSKSDIEDFTLTAPAAPPESLKDKTFSIGVITSGSGLLPDQPFQLECPLTGTTKIKVSCVKEGAPDAFEEVAGKGKQYKKPVGKYTIKMIALDKAGNQSKTMQRTIEVFAANPLDGKTPELESWTPESIIGEESRVVWKPLDGAESYKVEVVNKGGYVVKKDIFNDGKDSSVPLVAPFTLDVAGEYKVRVTAYALGQLFKSETLEKTIKIKFPSTLEGIQKHIFDKVKPSIKEVKYDAVNHKIQIIPGPVSNLENLQKYAKQINKPLEAFAIAFDKDNTYLSDPDACADITVPDDFPKNSIFEIKTDKFPIEKGPYTFSIGMRVINEDDDYIFTPQPPSPLSFPGVLTASSNLESIPEEKKYKPSITLEQPGLAESKSYIKGQPIKITFKYTQPDAEVVSYLVRIETSDNTTLSGLGSSLQSYDGKEYCVIPATAGAPTTLEFTPTQTGKYKISSRAIALKSAEDGKKTTVISKEKMETTKKVKEASAEELSAATPETTQLQNALAVEATDTGKLRFYWDAGLEDIHHYNLTIQNTSDPSVEAYSGDFLFENKNFTQGSLDSGLLKKMYRKDNEYTFTITAIKQDGTEITASTTYTGLGLEHLRKKQNENTEKRLQKSHEKVTEDLLTPDKEFGKSFTLSLERDAEGIPKLKLSSPELEGADKYEIEIKGGESKWYRKDLKTPEIDISGPLHAKRPEKSKCEAFLKPAVKYTITVIAYKDGKTFKKAKMTYQHTSDVIQTFLLDKNETASPSIPLTVK